MTAFVIALMALLSPQREHAELGGAIARVVEAHPPLFAGDEDRSRTAALLVAVAYRESSLRADAVGDRGKSYCAFQIHRSSGGSSALLDDPDACAAKGLAMLRESFAACRRLPIEERLSLYARGSCASERGRKLSRDRMALAKRIAGAVER